MNNKEIGGYFQLESFYGQEYHVEALRFNTARNCLKYLIVTKMIKRIYLPFFMCQTVFEACKQVNVDVEFYHINKAFEIELEKEVVDGEYVYIVNYYGILNIDKIQQYKKIYKNIIVDNTHSFFMEPVKDVDTIYSCRKFFGVPDGAYLHTKGNRRAYELLDTDISFDKTKHLLGRYEKNASEYYNQFKKAENDLAREPIKKMSLLTQNLLRGIDYKKVAIKRGKNYALLHEALKNNNQLYKICMSIGDGPFMYPYYNDRSIGLKEYLIKKKIYIPTLWSDLPQGLGENTIEKNILKNIIPLPCDQRYDENDMGYILHVIEEFYDLRYVK